MKETGVVRFTRLCLVALGMAALSTIVGAGEAMAECALPYNLQNGDPPDATKVMANYNALVACMTSLAPAGEAYSVQTKAADGQFGSIPALTNGQLLIGSTNNPPQPQQLTAGSGISIANGAGQIAISASPHVGTDGNGLYHQVLSETPSATSTGLSNWLNQGTSGVIDSSVGISMTAQNSGTANNISARTVPSPTPPYKITALIGATRSSTAYNGIGIGWFNGTDRLHLFASTTISGGLPKFEVSKWNSATSYSGGDFQTNSNGYSQPFWMQIADDGSTVSVGISQDGANFLQLFSTAKSTGWLGASGYSNVVFFINPQGGLTTGTLMSWKVE
ncbi:hypothetical protein IE4803_PD00109 (plasmid) [Rhizobium etli bv. phaseoli str. IE4803]|nr:hypothetical protein IE4803_PD00109 [Rhizobium etli bv. phaseoli str. IE4803]